MRSSSPTEGLAPALSVGVLAPGPPGKSGSVVFDTCLGIGTFTQVKSTSGQIKTEPENGAFKGAVSSNSNMRIVLVLCLTLVSFLS